MVSGPRDGEQWDWDFGPRWRGSPSKGSPVGIEDEAGLVIELFDLSIIVIDEVNELLDGLET